MSSDNLLDDGEIIVKREFRLIRLIPLFVMLLGTILTLFFDSFSILNFAIALLVIVINIILLGIQLNLAVFFMGMLCLAAGLNLLEFFPFEILVPIFRISWGANYLIIGLDITSFMLLISLFAYVNEDLFMERWQQLFVPKAATRLAKQTNKTKGFMQRYVNKSRLELEEIANNPAMQDEARSAAIQLLKEMDEA